MEECPWGRYAVQRNLGEVIELGKLLGAEQHGE